MSAYLWLAGIRSRHGILGLFIAFCHAIQCLARDPDRRFGTFVVAVLEQIRSSEVEGVRLRLLGTTAYAFLLLIYLVGKEHLRQ